MSETTSSHTSNHGDHAEIVELPRRNNRPVSRPRPGRSPSKPLLRTAFRNFTSFATVVVGDDKNASRPPVTYMVHKELLISASPFFAAALTSTFAEGLDQTVRLPEEKPEIFEWFLQWLYTGTLTVPSSTQLIPPSPLPHQIHYQQYPFNRYTHPTLRVTNSDGDLRNHLNSPKYFLLIDLYGLSDRLLTTPLSNHILSTIARLSEDSNSVPTPSDTRILYTQIRDSSPLRALILDLFAYKKTDNLLANHKDEWHARFLRDLVVKLKKPGPESIERHALVAWRPDSFERTRACEGCREVLKPGVSHDKCVHCERAFCARCVRRAGVGGEGGRVVLGEDTGGCKPWAGRGICVRYHEHGEGEGEGCF